MSELKIGLKTVFSNEGLFSNNSADEGGPTNLGISLRFLKDYAKISRQQFDMADINNDGVIDIQDIKNMTVDNAEHFFKENFWDKYSLQDIAYQPLATKLLDLSVNMGGTQAIVCLQRAIRAVGGERLKEDGICGPKTLAAINSLNKKELLCSFKSEAAGFYRFLAEKKPSFMVFLDGWLNRCYSGFTVYAKY